MNIVGNATLGQVVLCCLGQQTENAAESNAVITLFHGLLHYLPQGSCLEFLPSLPFMVDCKLCS